MAMNHDIHKEVTERIIADYGLKAQGKWLQLGKCPMCSKKELFTSAESPWILRCGRANKCGCEIAVKEQYPDIFDNWSKRFTPTEQAPNASAEAYLYHSRGLNLTGLRDCFTQELFRHRKRSDLVSATVRFQIPGGSYWERIIDQPHRFENKASFKFGASYSGHWWAAPDFTIEKLANTDKIFVTEGIFDALSLRQSGLIAVSAMSTNNYPAIALKSLKIYCAENGLSLPQLVFAFDIGKAGTEYTKKYVSRAIDDGWEATAAQPRPEGETDKLDWNDLLMRGHLNPEDIENYLWNGKVLLAENATEKAILLYEKRGWNSFSFVHDTRTWWASFNASKIKEIADKDKVSLNFAARHCAEVREIANCAFRILYFQRVEAIDEAWYYVRIDTPMGKSYKAAFTPACLTAAAEFKKRLIGVTPMGQFLGSTEQLDKLIAMQKRDVKIVEALDFIGYSKEHETWVLGNYAVNNGRVILINDEDYFDIGKVQLKLRSRDKTFDIDYDAEKLDTDWLLPLWTAFRQNGMITLTFWVMSLFAEQIRAKQKSLGFLEMSGIPGTGKSTILEFLWRLVGRENYEGFDPSKSTMAGRMRNLSRVANLPIVYMEADRQEEALHSSKYDWNEVKPFYGGKIGRATGVKNAGTETSEPVFRGSLIIEQNAQVKGDSAVMERIMNLMYTKDGWSQRTKEAAEQIESWDIERLSGSIIHFVKREKDYLSAYFDAFKKYETVLLTAKIRNARVRKCHAQLHAGLDAMTKLLPLSLDIVDQIHAHITKIALERDNLLDSDHPVVTKFWEAYDYLFERETDKAAKDHTGDHRSINRSRKPDQLIALNLQEFESRCRTEGISHPTIDDLKKHLKSSKSRPYEDAKTVNGVGDRISHCWIFRQPNQPKS